MVRQDNFLKRLFTYYCIFSSVFILNSNGFNCHLPQGCRLEKIYFRKDIFFNEKSASKTSTIICDVDNENFEFTFKRPNLTGHHCDMTSEQKEHHRQIMLLRWTSSKLTPLDKRFNFTNTLRYFDYFKERVNLQIHGLKGFDLNFFENYRRKDPSVGFIELVDIIFEFYHDKK